MKPILLVLLILAIPFMSAWPLQLLTNGSIIDLGTNETINGDVIDFIYFNNTLYIVPASFTNITYQNITENITYYVTNVTNITYQNMTIGNLTNYTTQEITWENNTYFYGAGNYTYNEEEIDDKFAQYVLTSTGNTYALKTELTILRNELNYTSTGSYVGTTTFWIMWTLLILIIISVVVYIINSE